jgi:hypothetical protein
MGLVYQQPPAGFPSKSHFYRRQFVGSLSSKGKHKDGTKRKERVHLVLFSRIPGSKVARDGKQAPVLARILASFAPPKHGIVHGARVIVVTGIMAEGENSPFIRLIKETVEDEEDVRPGLRIQRGALETPAEATLTTEFSCKYSIYYTNIYTNQTIHSNQPLRRR